VGLEHHALALIIRAQACNQEQPSIQKNLWPFVIHVHEKGNLGMSSLTMPFFKGLLYQR